MRFFEWGRIVKGVNTTPDVGTNEIPKQAKKFGNSVDKDGRPPTLSKKVKGKSTNVLFNLGLTEGIMLKFQRGEDFDTLHIKPKGKNRVELRGKPGYESGGYDAQDKLHQVLDKLGKAANFAELMNGETVSINPKHPDGERAKKTAQDILSTENTCPRTKAAKCQCESVTKVTEAEETITAVCVLEHGDGVEGTILLKQQANEPTLIVGKITGLKPGKHGFHIHEFGDLSKGCESAGGHYNPDGVDHGDLDEGHIGDLGNINADSSGNADIRILARRVSLTGEQSIVGRAIVVHSEEDDLGKGGDEESLKTGNAGDRLACGVITLKETVNEKWSAKYKRSINCSNPKGFSQKAHCAGRKKNEAKELANTSRIYVDMDGVLADFFTEWGKLMNVKNWWDINKEHDINDALQKIRDTDRFWLDLPLTSNAKNLLNLIKEIKGSYSILSSPLPGDKNSEPHKRKWIEQNLGFFPPEEVLIRHDKETFATQDDGTPNILIDDYGVNVQKWNASGGVGFKHKDHKFERTARNLAAHLKQPVKENIADDIKFVEPNFEEEWGEAERYPEFRKIGKEAWIELAKKGKEFTVKSAKGIENTDAADPDSFKSLNKDKQQRALVQLEKGEIEMPIVAVYSDDYKELVGGNTRLTAMMARDGQATVWAFYVPDEVAELAENFADGKKKGKSRPGRVKRAGASCNGSVTQLRKRAKNASGEKAKMYHWCANMKSGRKKK